jgi:putative DNA primase/helicase
MRAEEFVRPLEGVRTVRGKLKALCPAHQDRTPSLEVTEGNVKLLVKCWAGCTEEAICQARGVKVSELYYQDLRPQNVTNLRKPSYRWLIRDEQGTTQAIHERYDNKDGSKSCPWLRADGAPASSGEIKTSLLPLYGSHLVKDFDKTRAVYLTEGEKACDALLALLGQSLGTVTGASSAPCEASLLVLRGCLDLRLWPDNDPAGLKHMQRVGAALTRLGIPYSTLDPSGLPTKGDDAVDWIESQLIAGRTKPELRELLFGEEVPGLPWDLGSEEEAEHFEAKEVSPQKETTPGGPGTRTAFTDTGNAERLVYLAKGSIRYCGKWSKWLVWTGARWEEDQEHMQSWAKKAASSFFEDGARAVRVAREQNASEAEVEQAHKLAEQCFKHARSSLGASRRAAAVELSKSEDGVSVQHTELDADPWLFNCQNGTLDLRTGELRPHKKEDLLTKYTPIAYDPKSEAPTWLAFLEKIMANDQEMSACLQRSAGYSLTGLSREHVVFFLWGSGGNGKGTFVETLLYVLGEYGYAAPSDLLLAKKNEAHPTEKASLFGRRMAACSEVNNGRWDEKTVKELTGGDTISARRMREDFWTFRPTHKLWVSGNHKPQVRGTDNGIWRRLKLMPFTVIIPDEEQDKSLPEKLLMEASGILRWAAEGCLSWQKMGLAFPKAVVEATQRYREAEDIVGRFVADCCQLDRRGQTSAKDLYAAYEQWCDQEGETPLSKRAIGERLEERGLTPHKGAGGQREWRGIRLT